MHKLSIIIATLALSVLGTVGAASAHDGGGGHYPVKRPTVSPSSSVVKTNKPFTVTAKNFCANKLITITLTRTVPAPPPIVTYSKTVTANASGQGTVSFNPPAVAPGTYLITATQSFVSPCNLTATSYVRVRDKVCDDGDGDKKTNDRNGDGNGNNGKTNNGKTNNGNDRNGNDNGNNGNNGNGNNGCRSDFDSFSLAAGSGSNTFASLLAAFAPGSASAAVLTSGVSSSPASGSQALPATNSNTVSTIRLAMVALCGGLGLLIVGGWRRRMLRPARVAS